MIYIRIIILLCMLTCSAVAQTAYEVSAIPKNLLPYASAVVRKMEVTTEVKDLNNTFYRVKQAITVLNKNGDSEADLVVWYDKSRRIKYIKGQVYDEYGKLLSRFNEKNFSDQAAADGFSMFIDTRLKHFSPAVISYPYTIEYEYEVLSKQSLNFPDWQPVPSPGVAVEQSIYQFICKPDFNIRYKEMHTPDKVAVSTDAAGYKIYTWEAKNLNAYRSEPYSPDAEQYQAIVKIAPEKFTYEGLNGSFSNWNDLGKWVYDKLLTGRTTLLPQTVAYMHNLTDTIGNTKMKAKAIYEYMQRKSRYVSIQIGIGGFQPFYANEVDQTGYGDCKALVNYTQALLKAVNIDSYYCVVHANDDMKKSMMPDFASMAQGNHIILCLPFKNDTTWLECTSKDKPFGFLGDFTDDRWVLACTPEGGKLLRTPQYTAADSKQIRKVTAKLTENGELAANMTTTFEGWQYENRPTTPGENSDEIKKAKERYRINNLEIENLQLRAVKGLQPINQENIKFTARDYASLASGRYFFMANLANRHTQVPREVRNRNTDFYINRGYTDIDEIVYDLPMGYKLDSEPLQVVLNKPFGKFTASIFVNANNQVIYKRRLEMVNGTYPKNNYQELVDFYQQVVDADSYKVALLKTN